MKKKVIFITGPTASGKTSLALFLAKKFNGEIINADSRQVYKYLDIGSGKYDIKSTGEIIKSKELKHLFSIAHPRRNYSLGRWLKDSEKAVKKILKKNKLPIFCGGTILYLRALKEGWVLPEVKPNYKLRKELEKKSNEELFEKIKKLDPERARNLDPNNKRRLIRALEIIYALGKVPKIKKEPKYDLLIIAPEVEKEKLFKKIKIRLKKRVPGIIKEIKKLRKIGLSWQRIISFGLEYKWFGLYLLARGFIQASHTCLRAPALRLAAWLVRCTSPAFASLRIGHSPTAYPNLTRQSRFAIKIPTRALGVVLGSDLETTINLCYQDILRFAKRQLRELKKMKEVVWVKDKRSAKKIVENFLKK